MTLNQAAEDHSDWMLRTDIFSHTGAWGSSRTARMGEAGYDLRGSLGTAENIAVQSQRGASGIADDVIDLHNGLMNSAGHRANILNPDLTHIGIGIEVGGFDYGGGDYPSVIVTQAFGYTRGQVVQDTTTLPAAPPNGGNQDITGTNGADVLFGGMGADRMIGRRGSDTLDGGTQNDILVGHRGHDPCVGRSRGGRRDR